VSKGNKEFKVSEDHKDYKEFKVYKVKKAIKVKEDHPDIS